MRWHKACEDCILDGSCLFQEADDVESCTDVIHYKEEEIEEK